MLKNDEISKGNIGNEGMELNTVIIKKMVTTRKKKRELKLGRGMHKDCKELVIFYSLIYAKFRQVFI